MKITHKLFIFIAVIAVFCCANQSVTWFEAQTFCRNKNLTLTSMTNASKNFYWTAFYQKTSPWIKIIGCYKASSILRYKNSSTKFLISSPPLCQEYCLQNNIHKFAVQLNRCVCLSNGFSDTEGQLLASMCSFMCDNCTLLTNECGGKSAFNVFYTDSKDLEISSHCLSLQCQQDSKFVNTYCYQSLPPICNIKTQDTFLNNQLSKIWREGAGDCKLKDYYLLGNINLSDANSVCTGLQNSGPRWIGVIKETFVKSDQGQFIKKPYPAFFNTCQRCSFEKQESLCQYVQCNQSLPSEIFCSENTIALQPEIKESSVTETVVPVVLVLILLGSCAVIFLIYIRRKKKSQGKQTNSRNVLPTKDGKNSSNKNVENQIDQNYFVLQQSNPTYQLGNNSEVQSESPYNEALEGTYDHLGHNDARKRPADDIYNHASSGGLSDLSDYDVANRKTANGEDNIYDRPGVKDDAYGKFKSDLSHYDVADPRNLNKENNTYDCTGVMDNSYGKFNSSQAKETDDQS